MFGISWAEFLVILFVAVLVVPARLWPDVARFLARMVKFVRSMVWKITDASENIKQQIELEQPVDEMLKKTTDEILDTFSTVIPKQKKIRKISKKKVAK
ncbi:MAG: hypothetical protein IKJ62_01800 [Alphaproteobacteria bacterium]|nr:hypothetical protein [Alphaproteobacteria bacterium]